MLELSSFLEVDQELHRITCDTAPSPLDEYIPGAVSLIIDGTQILTPRFVDDLDYFWPYLLNAIEELLRDGRSQTGYPSSRIEIEMFRDSRLGTVCLRCIARTGDDERRILHAATATTSCAEFCRLVCDEVELCMPVFKKAYSSGVRKQLDEQIARIRAAVS
jgi:hypothetical protein